MPDIYRLILFTPREGLPEGGTYDTGANYPGCGPDNTNACQPRQFNRLQDAYDYAALNNEIPVEVANADEAWDIVAGRKVPQTSIFSNPVVLGVGGLLLYRFLKRR